MFHSPREGTLLAGLPRELLVHDRHPHAAFVIRRGGLSKNESIRRNDGEDAQRAGLKTERAL